jgi:hypothetical protein
MNERKGPRKKVSIREYEEQKKIGMKKAARKKGRVKEYEKGR